MRRWWGVVLLRSPAERLPEQALEFCALSAVEAVSLLEAPGFALAPAKESAGGLLPSSAS